MFVFIHLSGVPFAFVGIRPGHAELYVPVCRFPCCRILAVKKILRSTRHLHDRENTVPANFSIKNRRDDVAVFAVVDDVEFVHQKQVIPVADFRVFLLPQLRSRVLDRHPVGFCQSGGRECQQQQQRYARKQSEPVLLSHLFPPIFIKNRICCGKLLSRSKYAQKQAFRYALPCRGNLYFYFPRCDFFLVAPILFRLHGVFLNDKRAAVVR